MTEQGSASTHDELNQVIAEYLDSDRSDQSDIISQLIEEHPKIADELRDFFANHAWLVNCKRNDAETSIINGVATHKTVAFNDDHGVPSLNASESQRDFGDYELQSEIARGGMGVVFKARQKSLNRSVALKMILTGQFSNAEDLARFNSEAEAAANLEHPNIVPVFEVGEVDGQHYFTMALVDGSSLSDEVKDGPLPFARAATYVGKIAQAMAYAHDSGVIHRDLKPSNVLLDKNDEPKVTDFGLSKRTKENSDLTATGQILGTPSFMPPEQATGKVELANERADVYSIGAILYFLITGRPPFQASNPLDTLAHVINHEPVAPRQLTAACY